MSELPVGAPVACVDESGVQQEMQRGRGRPKKGAKIFVETRGKRSKKINIIAGYSDGKILGQTAYLWNTDTIWFCIWFKFALIPLLKAGGVIALDNASFHSKKYPPIIAEAHGCKILRLPKYSPDKNPIEHVWATMKTWLRNCSKNYASILEAISAHFG